MMMNDEWWGWRRCWTGWEWWRWWRCSIMIDGVWWWLIMTDDDEVQVVRRCSSRNWQQFFGKTHMAWAFWEKKRHVLFTSMFVSHSKSLEIHRRFFRIGLPGPSGKPSASKQVSWGKSTSTSPFRALNFAMLRPLWHSWVFEPKITMDGLFFSHKLG